MFRGGCRSSRGNQNVATGPMAVAVHGEHAASSTHRGGSSKGRWEGCATPAIRHQQQ
jgi:hypothetical protein